jgi:hypothetical protein
VPRSRSSFFLLDKKNGDQWLKQKVSKTTKNRQEKSVKNGEDLYRSK